MTDSPQPSPPRRRLKRAILAAIVVLPLFLAIYAFWIEPNWIEVTRHETGAGPREVKILHLTDLHFSTAGSRERRVLEIVDEEKPDLIVLTGDFILNGFDAAGFTEFLSRLKAPLGVYACRGNWEDWVPSAIPCYARAGVRLLEDQTERLPDAGIEIVGLRSSLSTVPSGAGPLRIALCHYPVILPRTKGRGIDLVFAGHSHGGQVRLPFVGALVLPSTASRTKPAGTRRDRAGCTSAAAWGRPSWASGSTAVRRSPSTGSGTEARNRAPFRT